MASNPLNTAGPIRFGDDFELDLRAYELRRSGRPLKLERIPMELLILLIERRGELVTREQIIERIWGKDVFLDTESGINAAIRKIRQVLKDDPERPRFVQTVTGRGYRFVAPVENGAVKEPERRSEVTAEAKPVAAPERVRRPTQRLLPWALIAVGVLAAGLALWHWWPTRSARRLVTRFTISLPTSNQFEMPRGGLAISPDGGSLVYSASAPKTGIQQLYLRPMDQNEAASIPGTEGAMGPFFSPDGEWIAFTAGGQLKKVPLHGGTSIALCAKQNPNPGSWGPDGTIVFAETQHSEGNVNGRLMRVTAAGHDLQVVTAPEKTSTEFPPRWPQVLPGANAILYVTGGTSAALSDDAMIVAQSLRTGERKILIHGGTSPRYISGHLVYAQGGRLLAIRFNAARLEVTGTAFPVVEDVWQGPAGYVAYDVSRNGVLVSMSAGDRGVGNRTLTWVDRTGNPLAMNAAARPYTQPSLSHDGKHIAVAVGDPLRQSDIWILDLEQNTVRQLTSSQAGENAAAPLWTPDGKRIIYASRAHGRSLFWEAADGSSPAELLFDGDLIDPSAPGVILATSCSSDGSFLIFQRGDQRRFDLWVLSLSGSEHKSSPLFEESEVSRTHPQISPDGRRLAYTSDESGREEIYVQPFPALDHKWRVSGGGGKEPRWSSDGHQLFFRQGDKMMAVEVQTKATFKAERPQLMFEGPYAQSDFWTNYDVAVDGQRFVMLKTEDETRTNQVLRVVLNWSDELQRLSRQGSN